MEGALPILQSLEKEKIAAEIQSYAGKSRIEALRKAIHDLSDKSLTVVQHDKMLEKLRVIVNHRKGALERIIAAYKNIPDTVSVTKINDAEAELAEAELRVLLREEDLRKSSSGEGLATLNRQLIDLTVDQAEYEARRDFITRRLKEIRPVPRLIEEYRQLNIMTPTAESVDQLRTKLVQRQRECADAEQQLQGFLEQLKHGPPESPETFADPAGSEGGAAKEPEKP